MAADFAKRQLEKHGWKTGAGLGRQEDGRSEPIKVSLKMDKAGVGHDPGKEFTDHWWLRVFNDAAKKIGKNNQDEVSDKTERKAATAKASLYKGFVKCSTLTNGQEEKDKTLGSSSEEESDSQSSNCLPTLDEIHKFCGGATGHRAARFGIKMKGKLARVAEHDRKFEKELKDTSIKKKAHEDVLLVTKSEATSNTLPAHDDNPTSGSYAENSANGERERKKKKKKRRHNCVNSEDEKTTLGDDETMCKQKKKKRRKDDQCTENSLKPLQDGSCETLKPAQCVETVESTLCADHVSKSRKSKRRKQTVDVICSEPEVSQQRGKKKKKKKRKMQEMEDMLVERNELSQKKGSEKIDNFTSDHSLKKKKKKSR